MRFEAIAEARSLLRDFTRAHPTWQGEALPVDDVAAWLGCEITTFHPDDYPVGTYGFLEPGERLIWLCRDLPGPLRRFTLAHELGHVVMHSETLADLHLPALALARSRSPQEAGVSSGDPCQGQDVSAELDGVLAQQASQDALGPGFVYDPRSERELAANLFAAELLMPLERIWELYVVRQISPDSLAAQCGVSRAAMYNRLAGLLSERLILSQAGIPLLEKAVPQVSVPEKSSERGVALPRKSYDEFQQAAIEAPTPALIVAGPGSGKTSTLIGRVEYLLQNPEISPQHILALTFSRKAAQEMEERLRQVVPPGTPLPTVSTFHAFCAELLRTHGHRVGLRQGFGLIDDADGYFLLQGLAKDLPLHHYQNLHRPTEPFQVFLKAISRAKDELVTPERYHMLALQMREHAQGPEESEAAERALEVAAIYALYQRGLEAQGDSDFGGLLMLAVQLLTEHQDVRDEIEQHYQHILVDEFQDINRASGVLLRLLAGTQRRVWVVGDANQAIYGFRGASPANINMFREDYPDAIVLPLSRNYRSRPDIVSLANTFRGTLLEQDEQASSVQSARLSDHEPYITLAAAEDETGELLGLVGDIQQKLAAGYQRRDIVVLCRTRALARKVTRALARVDLAVNERGGLLEQEHIKDLLSLLLLLADPSGMGILRVARLPTHPLNQADLEALLSGTREQQTTLLNLLLRNEFPAEVSAAGRQALTDLATLLLHLLQTGGQVWDLLASYLLTETSLVRDLLASGQSVQAQITCDDYARLLQYARDYDRRLQSAREQSGGQELPAREEQIRGFLDYLQVLFSLRQENEGRREEQGVESTPDELRVMTVHASKGLEFPIVYLPGLTQRRFPLQRRANLAPAPAGMLPVESESERVHESGEACLFYVGATRARDQLILSYSERYGKQKARRSGYIDALVVGLPDERVRRVLWQADSPASQESELDAASTWASQPGQDFLQARTPSILKAGQVEDYQVCPRRYAYATIYGFQRDEGAFLPFWQATSEMLKALAEQPAIVDQNHIAELFRQNWRERGGEALPFAHLYEQHGQEIASHVWRGLQELPASTWKLRQNLVVEIAGRSIEVAVDRIEASSQGEQPTRFVRNRFSRSKSKPTAGTRELLYLHALRQQPADREIVLESHNLSTGERHEIKLTARKEESLFSELEQALKGIELQDFTPHPDSRICPICPFFLICPA